MISTIIYIFLENIAEAIFFSIFILFSKDLKEKRLVFIFLNVILYLVLKLFLKFNIWFQLFYIWFSYMELKLIYKNKSMITDVFILVISALFLIIISSISYYIIKFTLNNYTIALILSRFLLFTFLIISKKYIYKMQKFINKYWNRHNFKNKIKSLTLRNICVIVTNIMFFIVGFWLNMVNK